MAISEAKKKDNKKWDKANLKQILLKFNKETDRNLLDKLEAVENRTDYIRKLILKDIGEK